MKTYTYKYNRVIKWFKTHKLDDDIQCESHHIIPKSCGGDDSKENLVLLPLRWHYIVHCWLPAVYLEKGDQDGYEKMLFAWNRMLTRKHDYNTSFNSIKEDSILYQNLRSKYLEIVSKFAKDHSQGGYNNMYGKIWIVNYETHENRVIDKTDLIPEGFVIGRCMDFSKDGIERNLLMRKLKVLREENKKIREVRRKEIEKEKHEAKIRRQERNERIEKERARYIEQLPDDDSLRNKTIAELKQMVADEEQKKLVKYWTVVAIDYNQYGYEFIKNKYQITFSKTGVFDNLRKYSQIPIDTNNMIGRVCLTGKQSDFTIKVRKMKKNEKIDFYTKIYSDFIEHGFNFVVKKYSYPNTRNCLLGVFKLYVKEYVPQKCNRWK